MLTSSSLATLGPARSASIPLRATRAIRVKKRAPALFTLCFALLILTEFRDFQFLGFHLTGWAWVTILIFSAMRVLLNPQAATFPLWIWAPWIGYVVLSALHGYEFALQSTAQIVCPVVSGLAASTYRFSSGDFDRLHRLLRRTFWVYCAGILFFVVPASLNDIAFSGFPAAAITALFFQSAFLAYYVLGGARVQDLVCYLLALGAPLVSGNRGPLAAGLGLLIFAIVPIPLRRRVLFVGLAALVGLFAFQNPKVQRKMFFSGHGTLHDLRLGNPNLNTNGRGALWVSLMNGMDEWPWLGHGGNADRTWLLDSGFAAYLPHNDWLRIRFNYGQLGLLLYILTLTTQIYHMRPLLRSPDRRLRALASGAASCFVPYVLVMFTDNVLIYCEAFTVPMMILVGSAYAAQRGLLQKR